MLRDSRGNLGDQFDRLGKGVRTENVDADDLTGGLKARVADAGSGGMMRLSTAAKPSRITRSQSFAPEDAASERPLPDRAVGAAARPRAKRDIGVFR